MYLYPEELNVLLKHPSFSLKLLIFSIMVSPKRDMWVFAKMKLKSGEGSETEYAVLWTNSLGFI